jgi:tRNA wybutosine-synthesizing protein 3
MGFDEDKRKTLKKFQRALENNEVDKPIIPLLKLINSLKDFYTTSSCAGRIILLHELGSRKKDHNFIIREHGEVNINEFLNKKIGELKGRIWLKQEPFIIHIVARTLEKAIEMLNLGLKAGLKHSGIFVFKPERYILELNGTQHLSVPIFDKGKILVSKEYFIYLLELANKKLQKNKEMRKKFENLVREYGYQENC